MPRKADPWVRFFPRQSAWCVDLSPRRLFLFRFLRKVTPHVCAERAARTETGCHVPLALPRLSLLALGKWVKRSSEDKSSKSWIAITATRSHLASEVFNLALALFSYSSVGASHELGLSSDGSPYLTILFSGILISLGDKSEGEGEEGEETKGSICYCLCRCV